MIIEFWIKNFTGIRDKWVHIADEFSENFQKGMGEEGHFQSKNLYCIFWNLHTGLYEHEKNATLFSEGRFQTAFDLPVLVAPPVPKGRRKKRVLGQSP